jgi:hypothetical protein
MLASIFETQKYGYSTLQYRATVTRDRYGSSVEYYLTLEVTNHQVFIKGINKDVGFNI